MSGNIIIILCYFSNLLCFSCDNLEKKFYYHHDHVDIDVTALFMFASAFMNTYRNLKKKIVKFKYNICFQFNLIEFSVTTQTNQVFHVCIYAIL